MAFLSIEQVSKTYGAVDVLHDISIDVAEGEFFGIGWSLWLRQIHTAEYDCRVRRHFYRHDTATGKGYEWRATRHNATLPWCSSRTHSIPI